MINLESLDRKSLIYILNHILKEFPLIKDGFLKMMKEISSGQQ